MSNTTITKKDNLEYLQFNKLLEFQDKIIHAYTLKSFDIGLVKEEKEKKQIFNIISENFNFDTKNIIKTKQTHSNNIFEIKNIEKNLVDIDGLITNYKNRALTISFADCICMMLYDPKNNVISNVHSGWKGTTKRIIQNAVYKMIKDYNCKVGNIICTIGPAIKKDHFIVNDDVTKIFEKELSDICKKNNIIERTDMTNEKGIQYKVDNILANKILLREMGLLEKNILDCEICTVCDKEKFHSYRVEGKSFKKNLGFIMIK